MRPLRVLCLHGYRQSGEQYRTKTGGFRKVLKKKCEYVFIDAPHLIPGTESDRGWWFSTPNNEYYATEKSATDTGFEETLNFVSKVLNEQGPFDGILAFSQGACLAGIICSLKANGDSRFPFSFAIIAAGYKSRTEQHQKHYGNKLVNFPTLHIIGETDQVIERAMSDELLGYFDNATVARHPDGHILPTKGDAKTTIIGFINERHEAAQQK